MKKLGLTALAAGSVLLSGCASMNQSQPSAPISGSVSVPLTASVDVGKDITGTSSATIICGFLSVGGDSKFADGVVYSGGASDGWFDTVAPIKSAAAYNAVTAGNADILIAPRYTIDTQDYFVYKTVTVTVTGKAGTIKNISSK
jgi:hypothetical protein